MRAVTSWNRGTAPSSPNASTLALVLAGGNGTRLGDLTRWECKPALPFGGKFRNIDFSLSNCLHSGIRRIAVLTQYKSQTLIHHLEQAWSFLPRALDEFIDLWPAQQRVERGCAIPPDTTIGEDAAMDAERFAISAGGVALVTAESLSRAARQVA